jgi:predicted dehydrogenase
MEKKLRIGIIGLGIISAAHEVGFEKVRDRAEIVAICDINRERAEARAKKYGAQVYARYEDVLANKDIDLVDIILPHDMHYPVCKAALSAGKHVLMEKPMTIDPDEGYELIKLAHRQGVKFMVAENTRFVKAYLEIQQMLKDGILGEIYLVRTFIAGTEIYRMVDPNNWKGKKKGSGGGVIMDAAPHSFYLLRWLFGEIVDLRAYANQIVPGSEVEDNAIIFGRLKNGAQFNLEFSFTVQAPWTERLEVHGSKGSVIIDQILNPPTLYFTHPEDYAPQPLKDVPYNPINWKTDSIALGVQQFVESVINNTEPPVKLMDTYFAVAACASAYKSLSTNKMEPVITRDFSGE